MQEHSRELEGTCHWTQFKIGWTKVMVWDQARGRGKERGEGEGEGK